MWKSSSRRVRNASWFWSQRPKFQDPWCNRHASNTTFRPKSKRLHEDVTRAIISYKGQEHFIKRSLPKSIGHFTNGLATTTSTRPQIACDSMWKQQHSNHPAEFVASKVYTCKCIAGYSRRSPAGCKCERRRRSRWGLTNPVSVTEPPRKYMTAHPPVTRALVGARLWSLKVIGTGWGWGCLPWLPEPLPEVHGKGAAATTTAAAAAATIIASFSGLDPRRPITHFTFSFYKTAVITPHCS